MNYQALVQLGFLENKPFESAHPAIHGFHVLSYVMKNHIKFTQQFLNAVKDRSNKIGGKNCISFHVRMGDLKSDFKEERCFIHESDLTSFTNCSIVSINPEMPIFISSDSSYAKSIINQVLDSSKNKNLSNKEIEAIEEAVSTISKWKVLKSSGISALSPGDATSSFQRIDGLLKEHGVYIVPVGELECFIKEVGGHGPEWVNKVLVEYTNLDDEVYKSITEFITSMNL